MTTPYLDIVANRHAPKWSRREQAARVLWDIAMPLFRFSPRPFWGWRRVLLRAFGAKVEAGVHVFPTVRIAIPWNLRLGAQCAVGDHAILYTLGPVSIGARATVSQFAHICAGTHEWRDPAMPLLKPPVAIGPDAWVCADAFIGPGVVVGARAIVAARAVVVKDVAPDMIVGGNPARIIGQRGTAA
jgi:putative colanic acid biosynthesis acetyltransferase WcaF